MLKPKFEITPAILNQIGQITEIKSIVERSRVLPLNEAKLQREAIIRMTHTSTSIEGNPLAEYQVEKVLSGMSVIADDKSVLEVKNYQSALSKMEKLVPNKSLEMEDILYLHEALMERLLDKGKTGQFRPGSIYVVDELGDGREKLRYSGPPANKVRELLQELLNWLDSKEAKELHPILRAGIFHLEFVTIHPFSDGNGRMARLLTTLILYQEGWDFRKILVLDDYYNRDRLAYYNALNAVQGRKYFREMDLTSWLEYFVRGFLAEAQKVADKIASINYGGKSTKGDQIFLDRDEVKLMDFLVTVGKLTSRDVEDVLGIPKRTAQFKLKGLVDKGLININGKGPSVFYTIAQ